MGRASRCNELISAEQRALLIELYTTTQKPYAEIAKLTLISPEKIKKMTADLQRPVKTGVISNSDFNALMAGWANLAQEDAIEKGQ